jgi:uncharacterized protein YbjQ (UPF0145 family)
MIEYLPTVGMFGLFFLFLIYLPLRRKRKKAQALLDKTSTELHDLRTKILVVSSSAIPGKDIVQVLGHVTGTSSMEASTPEQADAAERQAMLSLMSNALEMGANAVIDAKLSHSTHQQQGSQWMVSKTYYTGTAVVVHKCI